MKLVRQGGRALGMRIRGLRGGVLSRGQLHNSTYHNSTSSYLRSGQHKPTATFHHGLGVDITAGRRRSDLSAEPAIWSERWRWDPGAGAVGQLEAYALNAPTPNTVVRWGGVPSAPV